MNIGRFAITSDKHNWILTERYDGKDRDGNAKTQSKESYYATLEQCCNAIIQRDAKEALDGRVQDVIDAINQSKREIMLATLGVRKEEIA